MVLQVSNLVKQDEIAFVFEQIIVASPSLYGASWLRLADPLDDNRETHGPSTKFVAPETLRPGLAPSPFHDDN